MSAEVRSQFIDLAGIQQFDGSTECCVLDPLVMHTLKPVLVWAFDVRFQTRPARESIFARDRDLGIAQRKRGVSDLCVAR
jgi:hypothetical protein